MAMTDKIPDRKAACGPDIRAALGERLKAYYESMQDMPVPNHLSELIARLVERIDEADGNGR
jgi:Anti-sigma factor NepR